MGRRLLEEKEIRLFSLPLPVGERLGMPFLSLRSTEGSVAISDLSNSYEIASVVPLPRNDAVTQPPKGEGCLCN